MITRTHTLVYSSTASPNATSGVSSGSNRFHHLRGCVFVDHVYQVGETLRLRYIKVIHSPSPKPGLDQHPFLSLFVVDRNNMQTMAIQDPISDCYPACAETKETYEAPQDENDDNQSLVSTEDDDTCDAFSDLGSCSKFFRLC